MDDYAAQVLMHAKGLSGRAAVLFTAMSSARRRSCADARRLGLVRVGSARADISGFHALQCAWDGECGYFSSVLHDDAGRPQGFLRTDAGENANKGLDGVYPLVAGACTARQQSTALAHLKSTKELFSPVGLTAVDMSASYYRDDGYWNGAVWFSHQWFSGKPCWTWARARSLGHRAHGAGGMEAGWTTATTPLK
ncbi:MAG: MGH1-like glycoside hydrolase domain-containing protein [Ruthenibacterium lactatiformans]